MSDKALKDLKGKRRYMQGFLTKFSNYIDSINENNFNRAQIEARLSKIKDTWSEFLDVHLKLESLQESNENDNNDLDAELDKFQDNFFRATARAEELLTLHAHVQQFPRRDKYDNDTRDHSPELQSRVKLPRISLPFFEGDIKDWMPFSETFNSLINSNETLSKVQKFHYLKSCLKGEAVNCVQELQISADNYDVAWTTLKDRYDNKKLIIKGHIQAIHELPTCTHENSTVLRQILDGVQKHTRALKALNRPVENWDDWLIYLITSKIDKVSNKEWELKSKIDEIPTYNDLLSFLTHKCNTLETIAKVMPNLPTKVNKFQRATSAHVSSKPISCVMCKNNHMIYQCPKFLKLSVEQRIKNAKSIKLCLNCLRTGHQASTCVSSNCRKCSRKHNTLLHINGSNVESQGTSAHDSDGEPSTATSNAEESQAISAHSSQPQGRPQILLSTAVIKICDSNGKFHECRALLDSGSQASFISRSLMQKLKLQDEVANVSISGVNQSFSRIRKTTTIKIRSKYNAFSAELNCLVLDTITNDIPVASINKSNLNIPQNLLLADPEFNIPKKIDVLIGAELFWRLLCVGQIKLEGNLILHKTHFGWVISGSIPNAKYLPEQILCNTSTVHSLDSTLTRFWEIEECKGNTNLSPEELSCERHFLETCKRNQDGRFIVHLPTKENEEMVLGNSRDLATKRFYSLERRLYKEPDLRKQYTEFINEYLELGHMQLVKESETQSTERSCYLPHHAIIKADSLTTKLRVVFDASAKSTSGYSLNDILSVGPSVQQDLFSITCRFRTHCIVLTADITKMYRQVLVDKSQTPLQRILWRTDSNQDLQVYELNTVTYGTAPASFLATRVLKQLAIEEACDFPLGAKIVSRDFYVDDLLTGSDDVDHIKTIYMEVNALLERGGFNLRKWASNHRNLLNELIPNATEPTVLNLDKNSSLKTLGLQWNSSHDVLQYAIPQISDNKRSSKRTILSQISQIFDPLGLIGPVIVTAKMFMQKLWQLKIAWDESLPLWLHTEWKQYQNELKELNSLEINRNVMPHKDLIELHGFCDASERAYGACIYVRCSSTAGETSCELLCSKSRVAPLKVITVPRLELCAALLLTQLMEKTKRILEADIKRVHYWTDSTIVLTWINTTAKQLKTFVANRVGEIQELTRPADWKHVNTAENPADIISRGILPRQLLHNKLWWNGPSWLLDELENWPKSVFQTSESDIPERRKFAGIISTPVCETSDWFTRFSTFTKLQRVLAYCKRFISNARNKTCNATMKHGPLSTSELEASTRLMVKLVQAQSFPDELRHLRNNKDIKSNSNIKSLNPFIDAEGILRVGGRLRHSSCNYNQMHPMLLPSKHIFTKLLIEHTHRSELHAGTQATLAKLRNKFWPTSGRNTVRTVIKNCITCFKTNPTAYQHLMGDLPSSRVEPARPFVNTGIDFCGPFLIRKNTNRNASPTKAYVAVLVCMAVKAVHLELVTGLDTQSFLKAFKRFIARRGMVSNVYSDNGTNFVRANKELKELRKIFLTENEELTNALSKDNISWHFIPPRAPHFGGIWEAAVKSFKYHFKRIVGNSLLTFEEMYTIMTQIESILNSRPLLPLSEDSNDLMLLTPSHFLIGDSLRANLEPNLVELKINRLSRLQLLQKMKQHFWSHWSREYLQHLQQRSKWTKSADRAPKEDQLVLVKEENLPPLLWTAGRILKLHPGEDGVVRAATIKTNRGEMKRPTNKLCILPVDD